MATVFTDDVVIHGTLSAGTFTPGANSITNTAISSSDPIGAAKVVHQHAIHYDQTSRKVRRSARSVWFNLDNGNGTTIDDVLMTPTSAITITAARIIYVDATTGTVAAGNAKIGTTLGGAEVVAATAYENTKAVGTTTAMTIVSGAVAAGTSVFVRHTGVAATQAGQAVVEIEYTVDAEASEVHDATVELHTAYATGTILAIEVMNRTAPTGGNKAHTVDLKKGNASTAFASVLSAVITMNSSSVDKTVYAGTLSTTAVADGDTLQLVVATSGTTGTQGSGLCVTVWLRENPA